MMRIFKFTLLKRYIAWHIIKTTAFVTIVLLGLDLFIEFINEIDNIDSRYGLLDAIQYIVLTAPFNIYSLFPMISLLGSLIGLGMLASHHEITAMRVVGISTMAISINVLQVAIAMIIIAAVIGEGIAPPMAILAEHKKMIASHRNKMLVTMQGGWIRDRYNFIHINHLENSATLEGISCYHFNNNHKLQSASFAKKAIYRNHHWYLQQIATTYFTAKKLSVRYEQQQRWNIKLNPKIFSFTAINPQEMSLHQLYQFIRYQYANGLSTIQYRFVWWKRILMPLATLVMIILAVPFIFGSLRLVTMGTRIVTGIVAGSSFYLFNLFLKPFSLVFQVPPFLAAVLPIIVFALIGIWLIKRTK